MRRFHFFLVLCYHASDILTRAKDWESENGAAKKNWMEIVKICKFDMIVLLARWNVFISTQNGSYAMLKCHLFESRTQDDRPFRERQKKNTQQKKTEWDRHSDYRPFLRFFYMAWYTKQFYSPAYQSMAKDKYSFDFVCIVRRLTTYIIMWQQTHTAASIKK